MTTQLTTKTATLIGFTDNKNIHAAQDPNGIKYKGGVPVKDVLGKLFHWTPERIPFVLQGANRTYEDPTRIAIGRPDTGAILGSFKAGYKVHGYSQWLLDNVADLLDDGDLKIASAGFLRGGAAAWVQVEQEETIKGKAGFDYRPYLTAATSLDGSIASTYQSGVMAVRCYNAMGSLMAEEGALRVKIRHSSGSLGKLADVRERLGIMWATTEAFETELENLLRIKVPEQRFMSWADSYSGLAKFKEDAVSRGVTLAQNKKAELINLWREDDRVKPWKGTAFGVLQAANTYEHWFAGTRGQTKHERNYQRMVYGQVNAMDAKALRILEAVS